MLKFKKIIITASAITAILSSGAMVANAYYGSTQGGLNISTHWIPVAKDTASGWTYTNYGYQDTNWDMSRLWVSTYVTAYDNNYNYASASSYGNGVEALEGWNNAEAKIRNMRSAYGTHNGGSNGIGSQTRYSSWYK